MRIQLTRFVYCLLFAFAILAMPAASSAQVSFGVSITVAPPEIPVYEQPECPGDDYIWVPGYWSWADDDYYWVPGTWVMAPEVGYLWTPGYWGWGGSSYVFYDGYWGPQVGFYGGVNYGFGYFGHGYEGGRWDHDHFFYNRSVNNVNVTIVHNVYNTTVVDRGRNRVSYNGGNGGINERPTPQEEAATRERHIPPVAAQTQHMQAARANTDLRASVNHGRPSIAATARPGDFGNRGQATANDRGAVSTNGGGGVSQPAGRNNSSNSRPAIHPKDLPPAERMPAPNTGNPRTDQKYQQQQQQLSARQDQERQRLQQKQDQEHQRMTQQNANDARQQQVEQRHQAQTQQLEQRHTQQQQQMQQRQQPRGGTPKVEERKP